MSQRTKSEIYLEELQSEFNESEFDQLVYMRFLDEFFKKAKTEDNNLYTDDYIKGYKKREEELILKLPTKYEHPNTYGVLLDLIEVIEKSAKETSLSLPRRPIVGTMPTGKVNAMAIKVPDSDEFLVVLEDQLMTFANLISKAVAQSMPFKENENGGVSFFTKEDDIDNYVKNNPEASERFRELFLAYIFYGKPAAAPQYFLGGAPMSFAGILRDSLERFVVGHEYSHIILGHVQESKTMLCKTERLSVNEIFFNWKQEFSADIMGLRLVLNSMIKEGFDLALSFAGVDLFFGSLDIIEKSISIVRTGSVNNIINRTHPPTFQRRQMLRLAISDMVEKSEEGKEAVKGALIFAEIIEHILNLHWDSIVPSLYYAHEKGNKLDSRWLRFV